MKVILLNCSSKIAKERFLRRAREASDDEHRFNKRYYEYIENLRMIHEHYKSLMELVYAPVFFSILYRKLDLLITIFRFVWMET
jgi:deoxyadenosine/deoxycytidine kinase